MRIYRPRPAVAFSGRDAAAPGIGRAAAAACAHEFELDWDPATVGAVDRSVPGLTWNHVHTALLAAYAVRGELVPAVMPDSAIALARSRADRHRVPQS